ncbi:hypothetical protein D3C76_1555950 [compost metagenome]
MDTVCEIINDFTWLQPYTDGNKRLGRCLMNSMLMNLGITPPVMGDNYEEYSLKDNIDVQRRMHGECDDFKKDIYEKIDHTKKLFYSDKYSKNRISSQEKVSKEI